MGRIIHFELTAENPAKTSSFYAEAFGWLSEPSPFASGYFVAETGTGTGINGAIVSRDYQQQPTIIWIEVDNLNATREAVVAAGGSADHEPQEIPGVGRVAYVRDPEGVLLGLREPA